MSNPDTQKRTANPSKSGVPRRPSRPRIAIQAETGASSSEAPSQKCARSVKRFVREYAQINTSTGTERKSGHQLSDEAMKRSVDATKAAAQNTVKIVTAEGVRSPAGKCRVAVRGFLASMSRSTRR